MRTSVINLAGGPGSGKSTTAAGLFNIMKCAGIKCELIGEFAKDLTYEGAFKTRASQLLVMAEQEHRQRRLRGQVDWIITDSPIYLSLAYRHPTEFGPWFEESVKSLYAQYDNYDFFVQRVKPYATYGRDQTAAEALELDAEIERISRRFAGDGWSRVDGDHMAPVKIACHLFGADLITRMAIERNWRVAAA